MTVPKTSRRMTETLRHARRILRFLARRRNELSPLLILTHNYPDPDAIASAFALSYLASTVFGIPSRIVYGGVVGRMENREMVKILKIPIHKLRSHDLRAYANVALVDTQPGFANNPFSGKRRAAIVIDQHPSDETPQADLAIVDTQCGATSVILAEALLHCGVEPPVFLATALVYGILSDTLNLYRVPRADVIQTYLAMLPFCDLKALAKIQNPPRSRRFFGTLSRAIQNAMVRRGVIISTLGWVENPDLVSQTADFLLTYKTVRWAFCMGRYHGRLYVSLRGTNVNAEAGEILRDIFVDRGLAGGHGVIAGGNVAVGEHAGEEVWQAAESLLLERLMKRLRLPLKGEFYFPFRMSNG